MSDDHRGGRKAPPAANRPVGPGRRPPASHRAAQPQPQLNPQPLPPGAVPFPLPGGRPDLEVELLRPDDLVSLRVALFNARVASDGNTAYLDRIDPNEDLILVVTFPPQNIAESTVAESGPRPLPGAVAARLARPTRLVLRLARTAQMPRIPFTTAGLLDWSPFELVVSPLADIPPSPTPEQIAAAPDIAPPGPLETALELPYRLILSPDHTATWLHARDPVAHAGRVELWHTRIARRTESGAVEPSEADPAYLRAIWSPDYPEPAPDALGRADISPDQRRQIVTLTSGFHGWLNPDGTPFLPSPIAARFLMLSPLGGWLRSRGSWSPPTSTTSTTTLSVSEWVHLAAQGRDEYVRIVEQGYLYPFGHRASLITVSERRFEDIATPDGTTPVAYLIQFQYIVVREPEKVYEGQPYPHEGREMPIKRVRLTTVTTPHIELACLPHVPTCKSGWIVIASTGKDFPFHAVTTDLAGNVAELTASLIFIHAGDLPGALDGIQPDYLASVDRKRCPVPSAHVTFAPRGGSDPSKDNTTLVTSALHFDTERVSSGDVANAFGGFLPILYKADVRIPAVEQLLGKDTATSIGLFEPYLANGLAPDEDVGVFAEIVKEVDTGLAADRLQITFSAQEAGGLATPNLDVSCLARELGPLAGDPIKVAQDTFDAKDFFGTFTQANLIPKLFGTLQLTDLLTPPPGASTDSKVSENAPKIQLRTVDRGGGKATLVATLDWNPELQPFPPLFTPNDPRGLTIHGELQKQVSAASVTPDPGTFTLTGTLRNFQIDLLGAVRINFASFSFTSQTGRKLDVDVQLDRATPFVFEGDLEFVNRLAELIPPGLFGDPSIDITMNPPAIHVGFAVGLPSASVGVFSLENIKLSTGLDLPLLTGSPLIDIAFAERHHPFLLTVAMLGGGGFLHVQLDTAGIKQLEAALEFGANTSIDLGVASGGVHIMAGIYFSLQRSSGGDEQATLTGYFRAGGELSVLGIVSLSIELMLSFAYDRGKAVGRATVTVEVHVAFFSKSVSISMEKRFAGSGGDPTFAQLMSSPAVWDAYASAFA